MPDEKLTAYRGGKALRRGWTTGSCAAAASQAAAVLLLTGIAPPEIHLHTPGGITFCLPVEDAHMSGNAAVCTVRKDAGDDPDITNGVRITASVRRIEKGVTIEGGAGVGRITRPGLAMPVGEAAINPGPRQQIADAVHRAAQQNGYNGGFSVTISVKDGEALAALRGHAVARLREAGYAEYVVDRFAKPGCASRHVELTYAGADEVGVVGGISILGTSGIVEPMSEKALVDTIRLELDSLYAQGQRIAFLCPGNYGADFARDTLGLDLERAVKCSNFIGEAFDHAAYRGYPEILLVGHAGKLVKMAAGVMNTHSSVADARQEIFTAHAALCGAPRETLEGLMAAISVDACVELLDEVNLRQPVLSRIGREMETRIALRMKGQARVEFIMFTGKYGVLAESAGARALCERLKLQ